MHSSLACPSYSTSRTTIVIALAFWAATTTMQLQAVDLPPAADGSVDFSTDIQPLFQKHCIVCHGADKQESGLRLDRADLALAGGDSGKAILVGQSGQSRLVHYVAGVDADHVMPPEGERLSAKEIGLLRNWIDRGANWPQDAQQMAARNKHWAYQPIAQVQPPALSHSTFIRNPIDQFILAKLQSAGLEPSSEADRYTLVRRLYLDLLGLLPSIDQVDAFVSDAHPQAYERLVDRLLDSPHFGERWGRHWLDMARYADSDGYEKDNPRPDAYRYRDWVIDAINQDMPYDQFTIEQLAGDLLPDASAMQKLATAFHRQTLTNTEGGTDQEQFRVEACFDRTETTGAVWLGLTVGCARCHTHKYDAITQREYYQLFAFFNNGDEQTAVVPKSVSEIETYQTELARYNEKVDALETELAAAQSKIKVGFSAWEQEMRSRAVLLGPEGLNRKPLKGAAYSAEAIDSKTPERLQFTAQKDSSVLVSGDNPDSLSYVITGRATNDFDTVRLDVLADAALPARGPGNFVLSEITLETADDASFQQATALPFAAAKADHEQQGKPWLAKHAIDQSRESGWAIGSEYGKNHWAEFQLEDSTKSLKGKFLRIRLVQAYGKQHTIGRFKLSLQTGFEPSVSLPDALVKLLQVAPDQLSDAQRSNLFEQFSRQAESTRPLHEKLDALKKQAPAKPELNARVFVQRLDKPRETFVLRRGEFLEPISDAQVVAGGLSTLLPIKSRHAASDTSAKDTSTKNNGSDAAVTSTASRPLADRLDLARWLVSVDNPLTPRVTVNHVWQILFGSGLVKTANDFGVRGEPPTHPELLDWLAADFIGMHGASSLAGRPAWSRKGLIKLIVMSGTYRQASRTNPAVQQLDPQNQLLSRQNRLRVEGEIVRDISLDAAGLLSKKIGGPSVYPPLPPGIAELSYAGNFKWTTSTGDDQFRRGMYTFFKRTAPHPNLITFDCPDANLVCVDRNSSNTPLQALVALNNASFAEAARGLAARVLRDKSVNSDGERLDKAFRWCLSRPASDLERGQLVDLLSSARAWYREHETEARQLLDKSLPEDVAPDEGAAWIAATRVLINLDEFITRE